MTSIKNQGNKRKDDSAHTTEQPNGLDIKMLRKIKFRISTYQFLVFNTISMDYAQFRAFVIVNESGNFS